MCIRDRSFEEPIENSDTFAGNAKLKAVGYAIATGRICVADDSGLSVDALDGKPGVMSARFAGSTGSRDERDAANNALLLELMHGVPDDNRSARFECAVCVADPNGTIIGESTGTFEGTIGRSPEGENGLNYLCAGYKMFFKHSKPLLTKMATLSEAGQSPESLMRAIQFENAKEFPQTGRNDVCPCGSGKKYKKCCLNGGIAYK